MVPLSILLRTAGLLMAPVAAMLSDGGYSYAPPAPHHQQFLSPTVSGASSLAPTLLSTANLPADDLWAQIANGGAQTKALLTWRRTGLTRLSKIATAENMREMTRAEFGKNIGKLGRTRICFLFIGAGG